MPARRWGLRVATDSRFGAGHVARCRALAAALDDVVLYCDPDDRQAVGLRRSGYPVIAERSFDIADIGQKALQQGEIAGLLFDGYSFDAAIRSASTCGRVVRIDDFGNPEPAVSAVLNPNLGGDSADYAGLSARVAAGPAYALLDAAYEALPPRDSLLAAGEPRVLIAMGARDSRNASVGAITAVQAVTPDAAITVMLPETAPHYAALHNAYRADGVQFVAVEDAAAAIALYQAQDFCIGAAGVSLLERLACGLPSIVIQQSDNQEKACRAAERLGVALVAGKAGAAELQPALQAAVQRMTAEAGYRRSLATAGQAVVDGQGAWRAAKFLQQVLDKTP